ncbi:MAG: phosphatase PAP2 family protein [Ruminococcus sp.]|nr:phosphatase PAP2 family protein [Ruminococcus sp.]
MKMNVRKLFITGIVLILAFAMWTVLIQIVDVQSVGQNGTDVGFATLNCLFHKLTGVHLSIYYITDWLGLVPIFCCIFFGGVGFAQLIKRRSILKVDSDIIILGIYYIAVIFGYLIFEMLPVNYRPILIDGRMEASYPSSTTLLVLSVMPTVSFQINRRIKNTFIRRLINASVLLFMLFMVIGRTVSGVHWLTDIVGSIIFSSGLYLIYKSAVLFLDKKRSVCSGIQ